MWENRNQIIRHCIIQWRLGKMTFEEAMIHAVLALVESNHQITIQLQDIYNKSTTPKMQEEP